MRHVNPELIETLLDRCSPRLASFLTAAVDEEYDGKLFLIAVSAFDAGMVEKLLKENGLSVTCIQTKKTDFHETKA
jgi:hypothetical protein